MDVCTTIFIANLMYVSIVYLIFILMTFIQPFLLSPLSPVHAFILKSINTSKIHFKRFIFCVILFVFHSIESSWCSVIPVFSLLVIC